MRAAAWLLLAAAFLFAVIYDPTPEPIYIDCCKMTCEAEDR